ncbi:MAG: PVC-type heme-binding CxxCH protein [Prosthecobacter sp.]
MNRCARVPALGFGFLWLSALSPSLFAQAPAQPDGIQTKTTYAKAYGETKNAVAVDPGKDLPRYPAVEPKDAIATWQVKKGFKLELAANEPQVRSPIAVCFDERGRMFVCEMIDYSEMRDVTPHLGRISVLEDKDGDGHFETSRVFADDLPWPTGLVWANGGLYVGATPDIWRFEDKDDDGKAEVREKVYTGFGTGLKILNVQGLMNSFMWGQDNRIHILAGGGNRGVITCLKRPQDKGIELGGRDFWFDPLTHEFGLEGGGAQYGMSFDNYGRKFGCSNSDHLQYWFYDDRYAGRNPYYPMPPAKQSIAVDGGAAEVFRLSPDEPWRIIRTRWRIAGVVKGTVEGGGRVSGYFTGATGTTIYRGDAYGPDFVNNSFSGDAGGQLVHRKLIKPSPDGISLIGERPKDEQGFEFAASKDTWVRVVNFANAPDGCLHICDMYREVIEHPWSIPDEIKKHVDLNNGNDRGRIYRIVPEGWQRAKGEERRGNIAKASTAELVALLGHANGWHRDTAQRLLYERQDKAAVPLLEAVFANKEGNTLAKLHALGVLKGLGALRAEHIASCMRGDNDEQLQIAAIKLSEDFFVTGKAPSAFLIERWTNLCMGAENVAVRHQLALSAAALFASIRTMQLDAATPEEKELVKAAWAATALVDERMPNGDKIIDALLASGPDVALLLMDPIAAEMKSPPATEEVLVKTLQAAASALMLPQRWFKDMPRTWTPARLVALVAEEPRPERVKALAKGFRLASSSLEKADTEKKLTPVFTKAATTAQNAAATEAVRLNAIELLSLTNSKEASVALLACLGEKQPDAVQAAAIRTLAQGSSAAETTQALLKNWPHYGAKGKEAVLTALLAREDRALALMQSDHITPQDLSASQVQALLKHKSPKVATLAARVLAAVIPPSRAEVLAKFQMAVQTKGEAGRGMTQYLARCMACHKAGTQGIAVGPDLVTVKTKGRDALLTAILDPHKEVASQFIAYTVNARDGQTYSGIIANDTASSMSLKMMGGVEKTLQRAEIKGSSSTGQSLMPEGLETGMSVQDMADLLSYIEAL